MHTSPLKISSRKLIIITKHSALSHQLSFLTEIILEKIYSHYPILKKKIDGLAYRTSDIFFQKRAPVPGLRPEDNQGPRKARGETLNPELLQNNHQSIHSPHRKQLKNRAIKMFDFVEDPEIRGLMESLYVQKGEDEA